MDLGVFGFCRCACRIWMPTSDGVTVTGVSPDEGMGVMRETCRCLFLVNTLEVVTSYGDAFPNACATHSTMGASALP